MSADSLRLGNLKKPDVQLASRDYNLHRKPAEAPIMGIIGRDFFEDRLLTIDYPARRIFSNGSLSARERGVVAYKRISRSPCVSRHGLLRRTSG